MIFEVYVRQANETSFLICLWHPSRLKTCQKTPTCPWILPLHSCPQARSLHSRPKRIPCSCPFPRKKGYFFNGRCEFAKSKKRGNFSGMSPRIFKKGKTLHVFISIFCSACLNCYEKFFELYPYIRSYEKYDWHRKMPWVLYSHIHNKSMYNENINAFCLKMGAFLGLKISDFVWKRGIFSSKIRGKGVYFLARAWYTLWSGVGVGCVGVCGVCGVGVWGWGWGGVGVGGCGVVGVKILTNIITGT